MHLLFELSRQDDSLVIQVQDVDGEFLLIETADLLPRWVKPESVENRTFIHRNRLHLIKRSNWPNKIATGQLRQALQYVRDESVETACDAAVQAQINKKINAYPDKIKQLTHKTCVQVPHKVASLLEARSNIVSHAVRAFNARDEHSIHACRLMKHFPPLDMLLCNVTMTKFNYAQLIGQQFQPDKKLQWPMPSIMPDEAQRRRAEIGFKLSCGLEILLSEYEQNVLKVDTNESIVRSSTANPRWPPFLASLTSSGYFENCLEHSAPYEQKLKKARAYFDEFLSGDISEDKEAYLDSDYLAGKIIYDALKEFDQSSADDGQRVKSQEPDEESDAWLNELPDYFLEMESAATKRAPNEFELAAAIPHKLEQFIGKTSDYKGAVLPATDQSSDPESNRATKKNLKERALEMISDNLRNILTMKVSDSEQDSDSDMSDYDHSSDEDHEEDEDEEAETEGATDDNGKMKKRTTVKMSKDEQADREMTGLKRAAFGRTMATKAKETRSKLDRKVTFDDMNASDDDETGASLRENGLTLTELMQQMDHELSSTCLSRSFEHKRKAPLVNPNSLEVFDESDEDDSTQAHASGSIRDSEDWSEVDVELNAAKNILESFKSQSGLAGPSSNLLSSMGLHLPKDVVEKSSEIH